MTDDTHDEARNPRRPGGRHADLPRPRASAPWREAPPPRPQQSRRLVEPGVFDLSAEVELGEDGYFHLRTPGKPSDSGNPGGE